MTRRREYVTEIRPTDMNPIFKHVHECLSWVENKQVNLMKLDREINCTEKKKFSQFIQKLNPLVIFPKIAHRFCWHFFPFHYIIFISIRKITKIVTQNKNGS